MIYRVIQRLVTGKNQNIYIEPGSTVKADRFKPGVIQKLVKVGAVAPVSAPPLHVFQGWKLRSKRFEAAGYDAIKFLETDDETIAEATGYQARSIAKWRKELEELLLLSGEATTEGCQNC